VRPLKKLQGSLNISSLSPPTSAQENCVNLAGVCTGVVLHQARGRKEAVGVEYYLKLRKFV
jgi:hypothetical protein